MIQSPPMTQTLLAAAELWRPNAQTGAIDFDSGFYGGCEALRALSGQLAPKSDESTLGQVASTGLPRVLTDLSELDYRVKEAAASHGVVAAALLPAYKQGKVESIVVLFFRGGEQAVGAVELWAGTKGRFELSLDQSYYVGLDRFARISEHVNFPMGAGLPGQCWESGAPFLVPDLATAKSFLRSSGAESDGLSHGLGLPIMQRTELRSVFLMLSSSTTPIARVHEVWVEDPDQPGTLVRRQGVYGGLVDFAKASQDLSFSHTQGEGLPGQTWQQGQPLLLDGTQAMAQAGATRLEAAKAAGLTYALALPVVVVDRVRAVVVLMG